MSTDLVAAAPSSSRHADAHSDLTSAGTVVPISGKPPVPAKKKIRLVNPRAPRDQRMHKACLGIIALKAQGMTHEEIGDILGYPKQTIDTYLKRGMKRGWLNINSFDDPNDQLEYALKSKTVRNVNEFLDERDKKVTVATAKGIGLFKQHAVVQSDQKTSVGMALKVEVTLPPGAAQQSTIAIRPGTIGGGRGADIPIDAQIIDIDEE